MHPMGNPREHFWLTIGMSKALGADLGAAMISGQLSHEGYADMVTACRSCSDPDGCTTLLEGGPRLAEAPDYCVNRKLLATLRG